MSRKKDRNKKKHATGKNLRGLCANPLGCYRMANGTNGRCKPCDDDIENNQPMNNKERKQYEMHSHPACGMYWVHLNTGKLYEIENKGPSKRRRIP